MDSGDGNACWLASLLQSCSRCSAWVPRTAAGKSERSAPNPMAPFTLPMHLQVVQADTRVLDIPSVQQAVERALQVGMLA